VLYEMLTGQRAFEGPSVADTVAAILEREPDWSALPPSTPVSVRRLLGRCLEKDRKLRLRDIGDAMADLTGGDAPEPHAHPQSGRRAATVAAVAALAAFLAIAALFVRTPPVAESGLRPDQTVATRLTDFGGSESSPALSPDGRAFVFVSDHGGSPDIWLRQVAGGEPIRLTNDPAPETDLAYAPDGESVYFTRTDVDGFGIWQIGVLGGQPRLIAAGARGAAPAPDGRRLAFLLQDDRTSNTFALAVRALENAANQILARALPGGSSRPAWSADGQRLSYTRSGLFAPANLFVIDVATTRDRQVTNFTRGNEGVFAHAWRRRPRAMSPPRRLAPQAPVPAQSEWDQASAPHRCDRCQRSICASLPLRWRSRSATA
jgi:dipeptidyl aminopeptidase/acylaminoacyl peptidase